MLKMAGFMYFLLEQQNISSSFDKIFKFIWKVLFGPFRKYNGLCTSELRLPKFQRLKIQDFGIPFFTQKFFCLPTMSHKQYLTISLYAVTQNHPCVLKYISQTVTNFLLLSAENTKKLKTISMGVNMITRQMTPFFSYIP